MASGLVGIIFVAEISRLSRSPLVLEVLAELCRINDVLLVLDGVIADLNGLTDRCMKGIREPLAEYENELRRRHLMMATKAKALRGHAVRRPPTGYVADRSGRWSMDPYPGVREALTRVFANFERLGTIVKVSRYYYEHGICLPVRKGGTLCMDRPCRGRIRAILTHPAYKGDYVFGQRVTVRGRSCRQLNADEVIVVPGHHEPYVTPECWEWIRAQLRRNSPPGR